MLRVGEALKGALEAAGLPSSTRVPATDLARIMERMLEAARAKCERGEPDTVAIMSFYVPQGGTKLVVTFGELHAQAKLAKDYIELRQPVSTGLHILCIFELSFEEGGCGSQPRVIVKAFRHAKDLYGQLARRTAEEETR